MLFYSNMIGKLLWNLFFGIMVIGVLWLASNILLIRKVIESTKSPSSLQYKASVKPATRITVSELKKVTKSEPLHHAASQKKTSPAKLVESHLKSTSNQLAAENEDNTQTIWIEEIAEEMKTARLRWWNMREQMYDEMKIDIESRNNLIQARDLNYKLLEEIADHIQISTDEEKSVLVDEFKKSNDKFSLYVQQTIGTERFEYLKKAQAKLNEDLKAIHHHGTQISGDW